MKEDAFKYRPHPWHGISSGKDAPRIVTTYVEITPYDLIKYEVDKLTGYLKVDRPQRTSSQPPALYGFIPRTYCGNEVRNLSPGTTRGDGDPMDICVLSERPVNRADILISAKPIGGLQMVDRDEADDKIVAVLVGDFLWGDVNNIQDLPPILLERLQHYFLTYKIEPGRKQQVVINSVYDREHALKVIEASIRDYQNKFAVSGE